MVLISPLASNNFYWSCSQNVDQIMTRTVDIVTPQINLNHRRHCSPAEKPHAHQALNPPQKQLTRPNNYSFLPLLAVIISCSPALTHGGVSQIRHAAVRRYWGQLAHRMKQMKSFCWDVYNPVLTTILKPPRRLFLG